MLIRSKQSISPNRPGPLLIKGEVAIRWASVFTEPVGNGGASGGWDVEEEYNAAGVGCRTSGVCCCGWKEFGGGGAWRRSIVMIHVM